MRRTRAAFSLIELLVVIAIIGTLVGLLLPAVQKVREAASRMKCANNLKQLGLALHNFHDTRGWFPPGMSCADGVVPHGEHTGFALLLPFLEQDAAYRLFDYDVPWWDVPNYQAVAVPVKVYYCPSNRESGRIDLRLIAAEWNTPLPPEVASCDYALNKGANGALNQLWERTPLEARGVFSVRPTLAAGGLRLAQITDGTSNTFAVGEATGGNPLYLARDPNDPASAVIDDTTGRPAVIDQSWSAASVTQPSHPYYGSVFAVTAQYGLAPDPRDEPMNRRLVTPAVWSGDPAGDNRKGLDSVSGFRSLHPGGCNFLFCDGSVHFIPQGIRPDVYRALSTFAGGEVLSVNDF